ncbi:MAG: thioredoxin family protein, partial [Verrucomicrobiota bacterium]
MPLPLRVWLFLQAFFVPLSYAAPSAIPGSVSQDSGTTISQTQIGDTLAWYDDLENALGVAKEEYRPVIVFFSSPSDGWSNRLRVEVFADEAVKRELEHYVRVEIAVEDEPETARRYLVQGLPSIRILSAEGRVLQRFDGFVRAPQMLRMLRASLNAEFLRKSDPEFQKMLTSLEENVVENKAWPEIMVHLGEPQKRESLRRLILELDPFPRGRLVELLSDPRLAVRLGSLELLEEIAGNDFDFDPWESPQDAAKNREALQRWASWSESTDGEAIVQVFSVLSPEQIKSYIRDMISEDAS